MTQFKNIFHKGNGKVDSLFSDVWDSGKQHQLFRTFGGWPDAQSQTFYFLKPILGSSMNCPSCWAGNESSCVSWKTHRIQGGCSGQNVDLGGRRFRYSSCLYLSQIGDPKKTANVSELWFLTRRTGVWRQSCSAPFLPLLIRVTEDAKSVTVFGRQEDSSKWKRLWE